MGRGRERTGLTTGGRAKDKNVIGAEDKSVGVRVCVCVGERETDKM